MRDFLCTLNWKTRPEVNIGSKIQIKMGTYTQLIKYSYLEQLICRQFFIIDIIFYVRP
jgi:hypothetical protein